MALRIRADGRILCAALHDEQAGDTYLDDGVHEYLSLTKQVLVTTAESDHSTHGQWWWRGSLPVDIAIDPFYLEHTQMHNSQSEIEEIKARSKALTKEMAARTAERHRIWQRWHSGKATSADVAQDKAVEAEHAALRAERNVLSARLRSIRAEQKNEKQRRER